MSGYAITFARSARRELERVREPVRGRVLGAIENLAVDPRPRGCVKLAGSLNLWRIRVGDWRVVYSVNDPNRLVDIVRIRNRRDVYD